MQLDRSKDWKNGLHLGVNLDGGKYKRYREAKPGAPFQLLRRLSKLPPREKIVSQILPMLTYGCGLPRQSTNSETRAAVE